MAVGAGLQLDRAKSYCGWFLVAETSNTELYATAKLHLLLIKASKPFPGESLWLWSELNVSILRLAHAQLAAG